MSLQSERAWEKGFTLIEIMIVLGILTILAGIAVLSYKEYMEKAKITSRILPEVKSCAQDIILYCVNNPGTSNNHAKSLENCNSSWSYSSDLGEDLFSCDREGILLNQVEVKYSKENHMVNCTANNRKILCSVR